MTINEFNHNFPPPNTLLWVSLIASSSSIWRSKKNSSVYRSSLSRRSRSKDVSLLVFGLEKAIAPFPNSISDIRKERL